MISYVLPTRDRPECLARTLAALGSLPTHDAEIVVADNAGTPPASAPRTLTNGLSVHLMRRPANEGAAARNAAAAATDPAGGWIVMLDDDSRPLHPGFLDALADQPADVAAVCAEIFLPSARHPLHPAFGIHHESGGLPEVPIGCGVAYRRDAFLAAGGYDPAFGFYAEEYDLAARLIRAGHRIVLDRRFQVLHEKTPAGRSMDAILARLVRNNGWVMQRHAPETVRRAEIGRTIGRYGRIAMKERAQRGYLKGLAQLACTLRRQRRTPLDPAQWDRFTGKAACRRTLMASWAGRRFSTAAILSPGKNQHIIAECLRELGVAIGADPDQADVLVVGTLSPGPMLDALAAARDGRVIAPWSLPDPVFGLPADASARDAA